MPDLIYRPNLYKGEELFKGVYYVEKSVLDTIGEQGVKFVHNAMAEMLEVRKKMNGVNHKIDYGFHNKQQFIDLLSRKYIQLKATKKDKILNRDVKPFEFSGKIKDQTSYLIEFRGDFDGPEKNRTSMIKHIQKHPLQKNGKEMIEDAFKSVEFLKKLGRL